METIKKITILVTDDHVLIRESLVRVIDSNVNFKVVAQCGTAEDAIEKAKILRPMIIIMDINLPGINGIEATKRMRECVPESKILCVSMHAQQDYAFKMMEAGAAGYVTKNSGIDEIFDALTKVAFDKKYLCKEVVNMMSTSFISGDDSYSLLKSLSQRESDIASLIGKGLSSKQIGETLSITPRTVSAHRYNIFKKLKVNKNISLINLLNTYQACA